MAWTSQTALFFAAIAALIAVFTVWGAASPSIPRRGFLPMPTTRGDRLFVGLMGGAWIHIAWLALTDASQWIAFALLVLFMLVIGRWG